MAGQGRSLWGKGGKVGTADPRGFGYAVNPPGVKPPKEKAYTSSPPAEPIRDMAQLRTLAKRFGLEGLLPNISSEPIHFYDPTARPTMSAPGFGALFAPSDMEKLSGLNMDAFNREIQAAQAEDTAQRTAVQTKLQAILAALQGINPAQREFAPFSPSPPPEREGLVLPERPQPRLDPLTGLAAALFGFAAPEAAPQFLSSALSGSKTVSDQEYQDRLFAYNQAKQAGDQRFEDALARYNNEQNIALQNLRGKEEADFQTASARADLEEKLAPYFGDQAAITKEAGMAPWLFGFKKAAGAAKLKSEDLRQKIEFGLSQNQAKAEQIKERSEQETKAITALSPVISTAMREAGDTERLGKQQAFEGAQRAADRASREGIASADRALRAFDQALNTTISAYGKGLRLENGKLVPDPTIQANRAAHETGKILMQQEANIDREALRNAGNAIKTVRIKRLSATEAAEKAWIAQNGEIRGPKDEAKVRRAIANDPSVRIHEQAERDALANLQQVAAEIQRRKPSYYNFLIGMFPDAFKGLTGQAAPSKTAPGKPAAGVKKSIYNPATGQFE